MGRGTWCAMLLSLVCIAWAQLDGGDVAALAAASWELGEPEATMKPARVTTTQQPTTQEEATTQQPTTQEEATMKPARVTTTQQPTTHEEATTTVEPATTMVRTTTAPVRQSAVASSALSGWRVALVVVGAVGAACGALGVVAALLSDKHLLLALVGGALLVTGAAAIAVAVTVAPLVPASPARSAPSAGAPEAGEDDSNDPTNAEVAAVCEPAAFVAPSALNPELRALDVTSPVEATCPQSAPVGGRRVCQRRAAMLLTLEDGGALRTDHWVADRPVKLYALRPGLDPVVTRVLPVDTAVYFTPTRHRPKLLRGHDAVLVWAPPNYGWVEVQRLPRTVQSAVRVQMRRWQCGIAVQPRHSGCLRRPQRVPVRKAARRCVIRRAAPDALRDSLRYGYLMPRPALSSGHVAAGPQSLAASFPNASGRVPVLLALPQADAGVTAIDLSTAGDAFFVGDAPDAHGSVGVFWPGDSCPRVRLSFVYGAPARVDAVHQPDWQRAGWLPEAALQCE